MCSCPQWTPPRFWFLCLPSDCENKICMLEVLRLMPSPQCWQQSPSCRSPAKAYGSGFALFLAPTQVYGFKPSLHGFVSRPPLTLLQQTCNCYSQIKQHKFSLWSQMETPIEMSVHFLSWDVQLIDCYNKHCASCSRDGADSKLQPCLTVKHQ